MQAFFVFRRCHSMLIQFPDNASKHTQILFHIGINCITLLRLSSKIEEIMTLLKDGSEKESYPMLLVKTILTLVCMSQWMHEWYTRKCKQLRIEKKWHHNIFQTEKYLIERNCIKLCFTVILFRLQSCYDNFEASLDEEQKSVTSKSIGIITALLDDKPVQQNEMKTQYNIPLKISDENQKKLEKL